MSYSFSQSNKATLASEATELAQASNKPKDSGFEDEELSQEDLDLLVGGKQKMGYGFGSKDSDKNGADVIG